MFESCFRGACQLDTHRLGFRQRQRPAAMRGIKKAHLHYQGKAMSSSYHEERILNSYNHRGSYIITMPCLEECVIPLLSKSVKNNENKKELDLTRDVTQFFSSREKRHKENPKKTKNISNGKDNSFLTSARGQLRKYADAN